MGYTKVNKKIEKKNKTEITSYLEILSMLKIKNVS